MRYVLCKIMRYDFGRTPRYALQLLSNLRVTPRYALWLDLNVRP